MSFSTELTGIAKKEEENKPPSYHGDTTIMDETTLTSNNNAVEEVIKVDDAIESIGFGKFQRRVL